jgi:hypothetical protein
MGENGSMKREEAWKAVIDLATGKGPETDKLNEMNASGELDEEGLHSVRAAMIASRCALIAGLSAGQYEGAPLSMILGTWAGICLNSEMESVAVVLDLGAMLARMAGDDDPVMQ